MSSRLIEGYTAHIEILGSVVLKKCKPAFRHLVEREYGWLERLQGEPWVPKTILKGSVLVMEYRGEPVREKNHVPPDWDVQAEVIILALRRLGIQHNDINPLNVLVNDRNQITLIDWQWASEWGTPPPPHQGNLGRGFKHPAVWDDDYSLRLSLMEPQRLGGRGTWIEHRK